jgi:hypothetical protein
LILSRPPIAAREWLPDAHRVGVSRDLRTPEIESFIAEQSGEFAGRIP